MWTSTALSWEAERRVREGLPDLRLIPSAVGGDAGSRAGIITAKSISAKGYGVTTGEPVGMALRKCPGLVLVKADFDLYRKSSAAFKAICQEYTPAMESFSIDEVFLDMTGMELLFPDPVRTACEIGDRIREKLGFTVNIGIGSNKLLAKMASDFEKPDRVHTLFENEIRTKMWPLPTENHTGRIRWNGWGFPGAGESRTGKKDSRFPNRRMLRTGQTGTEQKAVRLCREEGRKTDPEGTDEQIPHSSLHLDIRTKRLPCNL